MAKIGTAHIEIKPVVNVEALEAIVDAVADAVARGFQRGLAPETHGVGSAQPGPEMMTAEEAAKRRRFSH